MRDATPDEYQKVLARIRWPRPDICSGARWIDVYHRHLGTEAAHKTTFLKRGKMQSVVYAIDPRFLEKD